jgi:hypothetical protein
VEDRRAYVANKFGQHTLTTDQRRRTKIKPDATPRVATERSCGMTIGGRLSDFHLFGTSRIGVRCQ